MVPLDARAGQGPIVPNEPPSWQKKFRVGYSYVQSMAELDAGETTDFLRAWAYKTPTDNPQLRGIFRNDRTIGLLAHYELKTDATIAQRYLNSAGVLLGELKDAEADGQALTEPQSKAITDLLPAAVHFENPMTTVSPQLKDSVNYFVDKFSIFEPIETLSRLKIQGLKRLKLSTQREGDPVDEWRDLWLDQDNSHLWHIGFEGMIKLNRPEAVKQLPELAKRASNLKPPVETKNHLEDRANNWHPSLDIFTLVYSYGKYGDLKFLADVAYLEDPKFANGEAYTSNLHGDLVERVKGWLSKSDGELSVCVPPDSEYNRKQALMNLFENFKKSAS